MKIPRIPLAGAAALLALMASACRDNPASPVEASQDARVAVAGAESQRVVEAPIYPAFDLELTASGSMQPGKPIRLHLKGAARLAVPDAQVTIVAPDFEAAKMSGFGAEFTLPEKGTPLPRLLDRHTPLGKGQGLNESVTLTVPAPGYYRVVASIGTESDALPPYVDGQKVVRHVYREIWLRVDRRGGRATAKFDKRELPDVAAQRPGPLHCRVSDVEERKGKKRDPACDGATIMMVEPIVCPMATGGGELSPMAVVLPGECDPCAFDPYLCQDPCTVDPMSCYTPPPPPPLQPMALPGSLPCGVGPVYAEYFNSVTPGVSLAAYACESSPVRHDWETRSPAPGVTTDNFSARFTTWQTLGAGTYTFTARATDGVRLWVDGELLIDAWRDQGETNFRATRELAAGTHRLLMEYYDRTGDATAQLSWSGGSAGTDVCFNNTTRCFQFWYYDNYTMKYETAPEGTLVKASYQDRDCAIACWWNEMYAVIHYADAEGRVKLACPANSSSKRLRTHHEFLDQYVAVGLDEWLGPEVHGCDTGWDRVEIATNEEAFVYGNVRKAAQRAVTLFGRSSERVRVDFDSWPETTSWYDAPLHHISIVDEQIWGPEGAETQAHEYGHSFHHKALGGIGHIYLSGDPRHNFSDNSTGDEAYLEGFAHFFATLVMPGKGSTGYYVRRPEQYPTTLPYGVRSEARASAWFFDLVDDANGRGTDHEVPISEPGVAAPYYWGSYALAPPETWDTSNVTPSLVGFLIVNCRKLNGDRPESVDFLNVCLHNMTPTTQHPSLDAVWNRDINGI